jgi:hypothetical protein
MSYISIVAKIDEKITNLIDLACQYEVSCLEKKKEKILNNLNITVQEHAICDEGGFLVCFDYTVTINGKNRKLSDVVKCDYWVSDSVLPNGKTVKDCAVVAQHYYV